MTPPSGEGAEVARVKTQRPQLGAENKAHHAIVGGVVIDSFYVLQDAISFANKLNAALKPILEAEYQRGYDTVKNLRAETAFQSGKSEGVREGMRKAVEIAEGMAHEKRGVKCATFGDGCPFCAEAFGIADEIKDEAEFIASAIKSAAEQEGKGKI